MEYLEFERILSAKRMQRYKDAANGDNKTTRPPDNKTNFQIITFPPFLLTIIFRKRGKRGAGVKA